MLKFLYHKILLIFLAGLSLSGAAQSNDRAMIQAIINQWNNLHNGGDTRGFLNLYHDDVLFYGHDANREVCYNSKKALLANPYAQTIVEPIKFSVYEGNIVKCDFNKTVQTANSAYTHLCYLIFKKFDGELKIIGEGDYSMDVKPGSAQARSNNDDPYLWYWIIGAAAAALLLGGLLIWFIRRRNKNKVHKIVPVTEPALQQTTPAAINQNTPYTPYFPGHQFQTQQQLKIEPRSDFENYLLTLFNSNQFRQADVTTSAHEISSSQHVLDMEYTGKFPSLRFAVASKWYSDISKNKIDWPTQSELTELGNYETGQNKKIFIVFGSGGQSSNPKEIYVVPLSSVTESPLPYSTIKKYARRANEDFYFNTDAMQLK